MAGMKASTPKPSILQRLGLKKAEASVSAPNIDAITPALSMQYGMATTSVASLMRSGKRDMRTRDAIYDKWAQMEADPIISSALMLLCTAALGGHETTGQLVFVEPTARAREDEALADLVRETSDRLAPLFNRVAFQMAYTGAAFGDAYARVYCDDSGVIDLYSDEMVRPMLVQPFEQGSRTAGYAVSIGERMFEKLDSVQMVRLKMPRTQWIPQSGVFEKSLKLNLENDDVSRLPLMPSMAGGSLLYNAEEAYEDLVQALAGLVGQRWLDAMDEQIMTLQMESMTRDQQEKFARSVVDMLKRSKALADKAVQEGRPILERIRHVIPVFGEKQLTTINPASNGRAAAISVDDVIFHARRLAGAIGVDLSMIGFADQMSGGLGDGGFFRVSAQAAERARVIRVALGECLERILDIHCLKRFGAVFEAHEKPWTVNFYGGISALEAERQKTRFEAIGTAQSMGAALQAFKDLGATPEMMQRMMSKQMGMDEDDAALLAQIFKPGAPDPLSGGMEQGDDGADEETKSEEDDGEHMDSVLDAIGRMQSIQIPAQTVAWMGFSGAMSLKADVEALAARHGEHYASADDVLQNIHFVIERPDGWFIHHRSKVAIFREQLGIGAAPMVRIELDRVGMIWVVRSVYVLTKRQLAVKMNDKRRMLERMKPGAAQPGQLAIAEYLKVLGHGS